MTISGALLGEIHRQAGRIASLFFKPGSVDNTRYLKAMPMRLRFRHATVQRRFREDGLITMSNA
ncbi:MAG: hypothetical protein ACJ8D4_16235, partial [Xanthobacteraceae bacterium]